MSSQIPNYPFDPTGQAPSNKITNELQSVISPDWKDYHFIIPKIAPFFLDTLTIRLVDEDRFLVEGLDWLAGHKFLDASRATAKNVHGSIMFLNKSISGVIELNYQTVGGEWLIAETFIAQLLNNVLTNPRITSWEEITNPPDRFPVIDHEWNLSDMVGMSSVVQEIEGISSVIEERGNPTNLLNIHRGNYQNPHNVTKDQVGLGSVPNYTMCEETDARVGIRDDCFMSPATTKSAIERFAITSDKQYYTRQEVDTIVQGLQGQIDQLRNQNP